MKTQKKQIASKNPPLMPKKLIRDIKILIESTKSNIVRSFHSAHVCLYWDIGKRIQLDILKNKRAGYGKQIVATLSQQLTGEFGKGFSRNMLNCCNFIKAAFGLLPI